MGKNIKSRKCELSHMGPRPLIFQAFLTIHQFVLLLSGQVELLFQNQINLFPFYKSPISASAMRVFM